MCLNPKWIYKKGHYKEDNYRGAAGELYEIGTYTKCGGCEQCNAEKANNWVVRNYYEAQSNEKIAFITLTYEVNPVILIKKDLQNFIKRLRAKLKYHKDEKIRYFACGEYGTLNGRPHWHLILYGFEDLNKRYLDINKKKNIVYQSPLIQETWGLGRTSIQEFSTYEIPYISLYQTPKERFKRAYKLTREKAKNLRELYNSKMYKISKKRRKEMVNGLKEYEDEMKKTKSKYYAIKESNTWSIALGWEKFYEKYANAKEYTFIEYIEDKEFPTPTPWVKKLANMGDIQAAKEMFRREEEYKVEATEEEERNKNLRKILDKKKKNVLDWKEEKDKIELL